MKSLLFVIAILLPAYVFSQQPDSAAAYEYLFLDKDQVRVFTREEAVFIRMYKGLDSITGLYEERDYTAGDGALVAAKSYADKYYISKQGPAVWFYKNQKHLRRGQYKNGKPTGSWVDFYPNGQKKKLYNYPEPVAGSKEEICIINNSWDSTGQAEVVDGNGMYIGRDDSTGAVTAKGLVKDGLQEGAWEFFLPNGQKSFEEVYTKGKFISGTRFDNGGQISYDKILEQPSFPGGEPGLGKFLSRTVRYPREAVEQRLTGTVVVQFMVETTGEIDRIRVITGAGKILNEEAMRVVKLMPRWVPAKEKGKTVPMPVSFPIRFTL